MAKTKQKRKKKQRIRFIIKSKTAKNFVKKYRKMGISDLIIGKALLWARNYAEGIVELITEDPRERARLIKRTMPKALLKAEKWIEGVLE